MENEKINEVNETTEASEELSVETPEVNSENSAEEEAPVVLDLREPAEETEPVKETAEESTKPNFADSFMKFSRKAASAIGKGIDATAAKIADTKEEMDRMRYAPVMEEEFRSEKFVMPSMFRTIEDDHQEVDVCKGAVAFAPVQGRARVLEMTVEMAEKMGVSLVPYDDGVFYLQNPYNRNEYIAADEYFETMRNSKLEELMEAARNAGASSVTMDLRKEKKSFAFVRSDDTDRFEAGKSAYDGTSETDSVLMGEIRNVVFSQGTAGEFEPLYFKDDAAFAEFRETLKNRDVTEATFRLSCDLDEDKAVDADLALEKLGFNTANSLKREIEDENRYFAKVRVDFE